MNRRWCQLQQETQAKQYVSLPQVGGDIILEIFNNNTWLTGIGYENEIVLTINEKNLWVGL